MSRFTLIVSSTLLVLMWGSLFVLVRAGRESFDAVNLAVLRFAVAGVTFAVVFRLGWVRYRRIDRPDLPRFALVLASLLAGQTLLNVVEGELPASTTALIVQLAPAITVALTWIKKLEPFRLQSLSGLLLATTATIMIVSGASSDPAGGLPNGPVLMSLLVPLVIAVFTVEAKPILVQYGAANVMGQLVIGASLILLLLGGFRDSLLQEVARAEPNAWLVVGLLGTVATVGAFLLWARLLQELSRSQVASLLYLPPLVAIVLGALFLRETPEASTLLYGLAVIAGVVVMQRAASRH